MHEQSLHNTLKFLGISHSQWSSFGQILLCKCHCASVDVSSLSFSGRAWAMRWIRDGRTGAVGITRYQGRHHMQSLL